MSRAEYEIATTKAKEAKDACRPVHRVERTTTRFAGARVRPVDRVQNVIKAGQGGHQAAWRNRKATRPRSGKRLNTLSGQWESPSAICSRRGTTPKTIGDGAALSLNTSSERRE